MNADSPLRQRLHLGRAIGILLVVVGATYLEFVYQGPPSLYDVALWAIVVPLLFVVAVDGVRSHPRYQQLLYGGFIAIGALQYLDGDWGLVALLFVVAGIGGLVVASRQ